MNYNVISQILDNGFDSDQLIGLLVKNAPNLGAKIKKLLSGGWGSNEILSYINKDPEFSKFDFKKAKPASPEEIAALQAYKSRRGSDKSRDESALEDLTKFSKGALKLGSSILAPYLGGQALQAGIQAIDSFRNNPDPSGPSFPTQSPPPPPGQPLPMQSTPDPKPQPQSPEPQIANQVEQTATQPIAQAAQPTQMPNIAPPQGVNVVDLLEKYGLKKHLDAVKIENKNPETLEALAKFRFPNEVKRFEKETGLPFKQAVSEYLSSNPQETVQQESQGVNPINDLLPKSTNSLENSPKSVLLPDGQIGEIESVKQGIAKVNVDGKERHKKLDELIESPLPTKDLAELYQDLLSGIETKSGQQVSRNVYWAGYDPNTNELAFIPHQGSLYVYRDISPEDAEQLTSFLTTRKTTGENYVGAWEAGSKSPIGAAMSALIQKLQKKSGGKGKEYSGKYERIYDALELAKIAAKKKKEKNREKRKT